MSSTTLITSDKNGPCNQKCWEEISTHRHDLSSLLLPDKNYCAYVQCFLQDLEPILTKSLTKYALYRFTEDRITQLNLYNVSPYDVFLEAITHGIDLITEHHKPMRNPKAWLRVTIGKILCEKARNITKIHQLPDDGFESVALVGSEEHEDSFNMPTTRAWQAFRHLSKPNKMIIMYKLFRGQSYEEISQLACYENQSLATLQKQYFEAIQELRQAFWPLS